MTLASRLLPGLFILVFGLAASDLRSQTYYSGWSRAEDDFGPITSIIDMAENPDGELFLATIDNGVFISGDNGETWIHQSNGATAGNIFGMDINSRGDLFTTWGRSTDRGKTWLRYTIPHDLFGMRVYVDPQDVVYVSSTYNSRLYRSTDDGATWVQAGLPDRDGGPILVTREGTILVGCGGGVYRSADAMKTWKFGTNATNLWGAVTSLEAAPNGWIYGSTINDGLIWSTDDGQSWQRRTANDTNVIMRDLVIDSHGDLFAATLNSAGTSPSWSGVVKSTDQGRTWSDPNPMTSGIRFGRYLFLTSNGRLFTGTNHIGVSVVAQSTGGGLHYTDDGGRSWTRHTSKFPTTSITAMFMAPGSHLYMAASDSSLFYSLDGGSVVREVRFGSDPAHVNSFSADSSGGVYAATDNGLRYTRDAALTWSTIPTPTRRIEHVVAQSSQVLTIMTETGILFSDDGGTEWSMTSGLTGIEDVLRLPDGTLIVATPSGVHRCAATGRDLGTSSLSSRVHTLVWNSTIGKVFAGTEGSGVVSSADSGRSWTPLSLQPGGQNVYALAVDTFGIMVASTDQGLYAIHPAGDHWPRQPVPEPLACIALTPGGNIAGGTSNHGALFAFHAGYWASVDDGSDSFRPAIDATVRCSPSVVQSIATFTIRAEQAGRVELELFDARGNHVVTPYAGNITSGETEVPFCADGLATGIYFYRLHSPSGAQSGRLIISR